MDIQAWWLPENVSSNWFRWQILLTNGTAGADQWNCTNGTFGINPTNVVWTNSASAGGVTNREFLVRAWYDCDKQEDYDEEEPHRSLYVTIIRVDVVQTQEIGHVYCTNCVPFWLTSDSWTNVTWTISPDLGTNGAQFTSGSTWTGTGTNVWQGTNVWVYSGPVTNTYTLTAYANELTNCQDTAIFDVLSPEFVHFDWLETTNETLHHTSACNRSRGI